MAKGARRVFLIMSGVVDHQIFGLVDPSELVQITPSFGDFYIIELVFLRAHEYTRKLLSNRKAIPFVERELAS